MSQLKAIYKDNADTICGNCDTLLFLGGKEKTTLKDMSETLGKETIDLFNTSDTRGNSESRGINFQKTGKELMSQDEISVMDGGKFERTGLGSDRECKEAVDTAYNYLKANGNRISGAISTSNSDYIVNYQDLQGIGMTKDLALPTLIA